MEGRGGALQLDGSRITTDRVQDAAQLTGERFARMFYGLLASKPSALRPLYSEDSQLSRSWCSSAEAQSTTDLRQGPSQIMEAIMASVGGQDPFPGSQPLVVTNVENVQSMALPDSSGVMAHITGYITFCMDSNVRRFNQSVILEPRSGPDGKRLLVRNDIVHYSYMMAAPTSMAAMPAPAQSRAPAPAAPVAEAKPPTTAPTAAPTSAPSQQQSAAAPRASGGVVSYAAIAAASSKGASAGSSAGPAGTASSNAPAIRRLPQGPAGPSAAPPSYPASSAGNHGGGLPAAREVSAAGSNLASPSAAGLPEEDEERAQQSLLLWVSGIPTEETREECRRNPVRGPEVCDALNQCLREHAPDVVGGVQSVDRKDERKPFAFAVLRPGEDRLANELLQLSKQKKLSLRGDRLTVDLSNYNTAKVELTSRASAWHDRPDVDRGGGNASARGKGAGKRDDGWGRGERVAGGDRGGGGRGSWRSR